MNNTINAESATMKYSIEEMFEFFNQFIESTKGEDKSTDKHVYTQQFLTWMSLGRKIKPSVLGEEMKKSGVYDEVKMELEASNETLRMHLKLALQNNKDNLARISVLEEQLSTSNFYFDTSTATPNSHYSISPFTNEAPKFNFSKDPITLPIPTTGSALHLFPVHKFSAASNGLQVLPVSDRTFAESSTGLPLFGLNKSSKTIVSTLPNDAALGNSLAVVGVGGGARTRNDLHQNVLPVAPDGASASASTGLLVGGTTKSHFQSGSLKKSPFHAKTATRSTSNAYSPAGTGVGGGASTSSVLLQTGVPVARERSSIAISTATTGLPLEGTMKSPFPLLSSKKSCAKASNNSVSFGFGTQPASNPNSVSFAFGTQPSKSSSSFGSVNTSSTVDGVIEIDDSSDDESGLSPDVSDDMLNLMSGSDGVESDPFFMRYQMIKGNKCIVYRAFGEDDVYEFEMSSKLLDSVVKANVDDFGKLQSLRLADSNKTGKVEVFRQAVQKTAGLPSHMGLGAHDIRATKPQDARIPEGRAGRIAKHAGAIVLDGPCIHNTLLRKKILNEKWLNPNKNDGCTSWYKIVVPKEEILKLTKPVDTTICCKIQYWGQCRHIVGVEKGNLSGDTRKRKADEVRKRH